MANVAAANITSRNHMIQASQYSRLIRLMFAESRGDCLVVDS